MTTGSHRCLNRASRDFRLFASAKLTDLRVIGKTLCGRMPGPGWTLALLGLFFAPNAQGAQPQSSRGTTITAGSSGKSEPAQPSHDVIPEEPERGSPRSAGDSTLVLNSQRTGSIGPGEEARFQYWAQEKETVYLLLTFDRGEALEVEVTPTARPTLVIFNEAKLVSGRIEFWQTGRHTLLVRNSSDTPADFTLVWMSVNPEDFQYLSFGRLHEGRIETSGDIDAYTIDVDAAANLRFRFDFVSDGDFTHGVALISPENGLAQYSTGRDSSVFTWHPKKPEQLILVLYADQTGTRYRFRVVQEPHEVVWPVSEGGAVSLSPGMRTSISLPLAARGKWGLRIEEEGAPFSLRVKLRVPGKREQEFRLSPQETVAQLQLSEGGNIELVLENTDAKPGRVAIHVEELSRSPVGAAFFALFVGCFGAGALFALTRSSWSGPFHHLRFREHHVGYCLTVALVSTVILAVLLWFGEPVLNDLQKLMGLPFSHLSRASGFTGFFITLIWIHSLVKSRHGMKKESDEEEAAGQPDQSGEEPVS